MMPYVLVLAYVVIAVVGWRFLWVHWKVDTTPRSVGRGLTFIATGIIAAVWPAALAVALLMAVLAAASMLVGRWLK
jgi:hypothetical protein